MSHGPKRFLNELLRRRVHRTAGAYVVVAIMVLEGADLIMPSMGVPAWTYDLLVVFVVTLFPVAVVASWVFDLTPRGLRRTEVTKVAGYDRSLTPRESEVLNDAALPPAPVAVSTGPSGDDSIIDSLAILRFHAVGDDADDEYLCEGIAESVINRMSRLSGLRVVPRTSAFRYGDREQDLAVVGTELSVRAVVTGRVQHRGDTLLVQAELVEIDGPRQLWGERYSRPMADIFDVQEDMATEIYKALSQTLSQEDAATLRYRETEHAEAYQVYLKGRYHWNRRTADGFREATKYFRDAIGKDPSYAQAYAGLADTYNVLGYYSAQAPKDSYPPAKVAAEKALEIDPTLAEAHASLGYATLFYDRDWEAAAQHFRDAIRYNPTYASAHQWYAWYFMVIEDFEQCVECLEEAQRLDPLSLIINDHLAYGYLLTGRMSEARGQIRTTQGLSPDYPLALWRLGDYRVAQREPERAVDAYRMAADVTDGRHCLGYLGMAMAEMGDLAGAEATLERLDMDSSVRFISPLDRALIFSGMGQRDLAFRWLDKAIEARVSDVVRMKLLPWPSAMRSDPRFGEMVERLNLPPGTDYPGAVPEAD